jgi:hypothetical protein
MAKGWRRALISAALVAAAALGLGWPLARLASSLAARSLARLTPVPFATIDSPSPNAAVGVLVTVKGRVVHETIRAPLWLFVSEAGRAWEPQAPLDTSSDFWQQEVELFGRKGTRYRLAVAAVELPLQNELRRRLAERPFPPWMHDLEWRLQERHARRTAPLGDGSYPPLDDGAHIVTSVDVVVGTDRYSASWFGP